MLIQEYGLSVKHQEVSYQYLNTVQFSDKTVKIKC